MKSILITLITCLAFINVGKSQSFIPGNSYLDLTNYVEYIAGNLPVVISVPHGGYLEPSSIPNRSCSGCSYVRDSYTQELANEIKDAFFQKTGCYPHIIINLLHRKKFDANRDIGDAADGNATVEAAWYNYHNFIDTAKHHIAANYNRGMFFDLHGHGHTIQRIELGYGLSKTELQLSDANLNTSTYVNESSIKLLTSDNLQNLTHAELLRGDLSFGTLLDNKGFPSVPSKFDPFPQSTEPYFSGGYNTRRYGSENADTLDAIQIECNSGIRFNASLRQNFADSVTQSMLKLIDLHYMDNFEGNYCNLLTSTESTFSNAVDIKIYPNPSCQEIFIENHQLNAGKIEVFNTLGQPVLFTNLEIGTNRITINTLNNGFYWIRIIEKGKVVFQDKVFKMCD